MSAQNLFIIWPVHFSKIKFKVWQALQPICQCLGISVKVHEHSGSNIQEKCKYKISYRWIICNPVQIPSCKSL